MSDPSEGAIRVADTGGMPVLGENVDPAVDVVAGDGIELQLDWSFLQTSGWTERKAWSLLGEAG